MHCNFEISEYETPAMRLPSNGTRRKSQLKHLDEGVKLSPQSMPRTMTQKFSESDEILKTPKVAPPEVLIVDDNTFNIQTLEMLMKIKFKIQVMTANDGSQGVARVVERLKMTGKGNTPYKLVLMDMQMPEMDGVEASKQIIEICQKNNKDRPYIVILTAHVDDILKKSCKEVGVDQIEMKPIRMDTLQELLTKVGIL